jgi:hypothetical protein
MNQHDDFNKAMREATRGVIEYVQTGRASGLSICEDRQAIEESHEVAKAVAEALLVGGC